MPRRTKRPPPRAARQAAAASLAAAKEDMRRAQSELAGTGKNRAHLRLISPVDGIVTARLAEPGSTVVAGQAVVQVIDPASLVVARAHRPGPLATAWRSACRPRSPCARAPARTAARPHRARRSGRRCGDRGTHRQRGVRRAPDGIAIGELAEVTLRLPAIEKALAIPAAALQRQGNQSGVWQAGRWPGAHSLPITPGVTSSDGLVESARASALATR